MDSPESYELTDDFAPSAPVKPYRLHARIAWILMALVAVLSVVPILGFASWFIAGPMLLVSFIMMVLVLVHGGVAHGLVLLACQIIVMPFIVFFGPIISSTLGFIGAAAGAGAALSSSLESASSAVSTVSEIASAPTHSHVGGPSPAAPVQEIQLPSVSLPADLLAWKNQLERQQDSIASWLGNGLASETPSGFLKSGDSMDVEARKSLQEENLLREKIFSKIAELTGNSPAEVARTYARLAAKSSP